MPTHFAQRVIDGVDAPAIAAADVVASAGFGSTRAVAVTSGSKDRRGRITVTAGGSGLAANPTVAVTFKEAFESAPFVAVNRADVLATAGLLRVTARTTTGFTVTFVGTPADTEAYILDYLVTG
jgi:hypothetical protein